MKKNENKKIQILQLKQWINGHIPEMDNTEEPAWGYQCACFSQIKFEMLIRYPIGN